MITLKEYTQSQPIKRTGSDFVIVVESHRPDQVETWVSIGIAGTDDEQQAIEAFEDFARIEMEAGHTIAAPNGDRWFKLTRAIRDPSPEIAREIERFTWNEKRSRVRAVVEVIKISANGERTATPIRYVWIKY